MVDVTFNANSHIVEIDYNRLPTVDEISEYSIRKHLTERLEAFNIRIPITPADEGWPDYESVSIPSIYLFVGESQDEGVELGSDGSEYIVNLYIFAKHDAMRTRLGYLMKDIFRKTIPIFNYVTGNEADPEPTGEYFITQNVGWQKIQHVYNASDAERWRSVVTAVLARVE